MRLLPFLETLYLAYGRSLSSKLARTILAGKTNEADYQGSIGFAWERVVAWRSGQVYDRPDSRRLWEVRSPGGPLNVARDCNKKGRCQDLVPQRPHGCGGWI